MKRKKLVRPGESLCEIFDGRIRCIQPDSGYRFSMDALLLAMFAFDRDARTVIDLGTGSGILMVLLCASDHIGQVTGLEIQADMVDRARRNISLHGLEERATVLEGDIRQVQSLFASASFDMVVSNPPFYPIGSGRLNPDPAVAAARHEVLCTLEQLLRAARHLVRASGQILIIYPATLLTRVFDTARRCGLCVATLQPVHSRTDSAAKLVLVEFRHGSARELTLAPPLVLYDDEGNYTKALMDFVERLPAT